MRSLLLLLFVSSAPASDPALFRFHTARALFQSEQYAAALQQLQASEEARESAPLRALYRGMCLANLERWPEARNALQPFVRETPRSAEGWYWLGASEYYTKNFPAALAALNQAVELRPQDADAYRMRGLVHLQRNEWNEGYRDWIQAIRWNPSDGKTLYYLGRLFQEAGHSDQCKLWLEDAVRVAPEHFEALTYLGLCEEGLGNGARSRDLYERAIKASVQQGKPYSWAFASAGSLALRNGDAERARRVLEQGVTLVPEPHLLYALAKLLIGDREYPRAEALLRQAVVKDPGYPEAHYQLGRLLAATGRPSEAKQHTELFQRAKEVQSRLPRVKLSLR